MSQANSLMLIVETEKFPGSPGFPLSSHWSEWHRCPLKNSYYQTGWNYHVSLNWPGFIPCCWAPGLGDHLVPQRGQKNPGVTLQLLITERHKIVSGSAFWAMADYRAFVWKNMTLHFSGLVYFLSITQPASLTRLVTWLVEDNSVRVKAGWAEGGEMQWNCRILSSRVG